MPERIYRMPGFGALVASLVLVAILLCSAARITYLAAQDTTEMTATATPVGMAPEVAVAWIRWQSPRVGR